MIRVLLPLATLGGLLIASSPVAFAQKASTVSPGQQSVGSGTTPATGAPGASGSAPGQYYIDSGKTPTGGTPGASGYSPGHMKPRPASP
jgi:hypothetical protein